MACVVNNCCFCADLRTGSFIIGYLSLVLSLIVSIIYILAVIGAAFIAFPAAIIVFCLYLAINGIRLLFTIMLLVGLHQNRRQYVLPFLIYGVVFTALAAALFITNIFFYTDAIDIIVAIIDLLLNIYFLVVIRSYYLTMGAPTPVTVVNQPQMYPMHQQPYMMARQQQPDDMSKPQQFA